MKRKSYKTKKAANGLQDIAVPEQGSTSDVLSSATSLASSGAAIGGPWGALAGGVIGLSTGLLQKSRQDNANSKAKYTNQVNKASRAYAGDEETINQGMQRFSKGGKVNTKVIEIEGKKTPEIHTDKDFNVKNLGQTPHSKGGDKVVAEEGDIVFNTQNSLSKFNKIAAAIDNGDHKTLKAEKNKLPDDKPTKIKNPDGNNSIMKPGKKMPKQTLRDPAKEFLTNIGNSFLKGTRYSASYDPNTNKSSIVDKAITKQQATKPASTNTFNASNQNLIPQAPAPQPKPKFDNRGGYVLPYNPKTSSSFTTKKNTSSKSNSILPTVNPNKAISQLAPSTVGLDATIKDTSIPTTLPNKLNNAATSTNAGGTVTTKSNANVGSMANNALQFAGVANNLFQGLKNERPLQENYVDPTKIKYTDRSNSLRAQSNSIANVNNANARNLSGGNAGNLRANMAASGVANMNRQAGIDEREQSRADAITAQNTETSNQANQLNAQRRDNYQQAMMQNRAAKQAYIDQAASDIGQYGMAKREEGYLRDRDAKADASQLAGYRSINGRYQHKSNLDGSTYFEGDADSAITKYGTSGGDRKTKTTKKSLFKNGGVVGKNKYKTK